MVILITDGENATAGVSNTGVPIGIDMNALAEGAKGAIGAELCGKPFRWDQRLFALILGRGAGGDGGGGGIGYAMSPMQTMLKVGGECRRVFPSVAAFAMAWWCWGVGVDGSGGGFRQATPTPGDGYRSRVMRAVVACFCVCVSPFFGFIFSLRPKILPSSLPPKRWLQSSFHYNLYTKHITQVCFLTTGVRVGIKRVRPTLHTFAAS